MSIAIGASTAPKILSLGGGERDRATDTRSPRGRKSVPAARGVVVRSGTLRGGAIGSGALIALAVGVGLGALLRH